MIFYEDPDDQKPSWKFRVVRNLMMFWAMFVAVSGVGIIALLITLPPATAIVEAIVNSGCGSNSPRDAIVDAGDASVLRVVSGPGDLAIVGRSGLTEVRVAGSACASHDARDRVDEILLQAISDGDEIVVTVQLPASIEGGELNLEIRVPATIDRVEVEDSEGMTFVTNVRHLEAAVGNGRLQASGVTGGVSVPSLRGSLSLRDVDGDVIVGEVLGFGDVDVDGVDGSVDLGDNASGPARITDVMGDVRVGSAGYGDLTVRRVSGDLVVERNPGGRISVEDVGGSVRVPEPGDGPDA